MTLGLSGDGFPQIQPVGIIAFDQIDLPIPPPFLDLLFPQNGLNHLVVAFKPDKPIDAVLGCKTSRCLAFMLVNAPDNVVCDAEIERSVLAAGEEVERNAAWIAA